MKKYFWENYTQEKLLSLKIKDLGLTFTNRLKVATDIVCEELANKGLKMLPLAFILSDDWYCPDYTTNIHIPFYLCHSKLIELELDKMGYVEGINSDYLLKLLRHEIGHAFDNYFGLRRKKSYRNTFGKVSNPYCYGNHYYDSSNSDFVVNLDEGYAQKHPVEDFSETFAIWLREPESYWKLKYKNTMVIYKLNYVDDLVKNVSGLHRCRLKNTNYPIDKIDRTLKKYYQYKRESKGINLNCQTK